jgi:hypothetical protein
MLTKLITYTVVFEPLKGRRLTEAWGSGVAKASHALMHPIISMSLKNT